MRPVLADPFEPFAEVARRLNLAARIVAAQEWIQESADPFEIVGLLWDLEREVVLAIEQNEDLEEVVA